MESAIFFVIASLAVCENDRLINNSSKMLINEICFIKFDV
jgi:hypothetical protein